MKPLALLLVLALLAAVPYSAHADDGRTITMKMEDADIIDAIQAIAKVAGVNVIVSPEVKGKITISFKDTPVLDALESVAQATGFKLEKSKHGIYTIAPAKAAPPPAEGGWSERKAKARKAAAAQKLDELTAHLDEAKQADDVGKIRKLTAELEAVTARIAHLQRKDSDMRKQRTAAEDARKKVERLLVDSANSARALEAALARAAAARSEGGAGGAGGEARTLQLFDVRDLQKAGHKIEGVARKVLGHDGTATLQGERLIVQSNADGLQRLTAKLEELRAGSAFATRLLRGRVAAEQPTLVRKVVKSEKKTKKPWTVTWSTSSERAPKRWSFVDDGQDRAMEQRIDKLTQAGRLLAAAGDQQGARRAYVRANQMKTELADRRKQRQTAARANYERGARRVSGGDAQTLRAINTLRKDVNALRSEVRDLTALVRRLLEQRR